MTAEVTLPNTVSEVWESVGSVIVIIVCAMLMRIVVGRSISKVKKLMFDRDRERVENGGAERGQRVESRINTVTQVLRSLASVAIFIVAVMLILGEVDVSLAPLLASAGIVGVALGFGAQSLVRDMLSGIFVLVEDQYGIGDWIATPVASGRVERFTLRSTQIRDESGTVWHIPNGSIEGVGNKSQKWARAVVDVGISVDSDVAAARKVIAAAAKQFAESGSEAAGLLVSDPLDQGVIDMGAQGVTLRVIVDTEPSAQWMVERELRQHIKVALDEAGIRLQIHHITGGES